MNKRPLRNHTPALKASMALDALKGHRTLAELPEQFDVQTSKVTTWKARLEGAAA